MQARLLTLLAIVLLIVGVAAAVVVRAGSLRSAALEALDLTVGRPVSDDPRPVHFVVRQGDTATTVAQNLETAGLVRSSLGFRLAARLSGVASHLEAGDYELRPNMPLNQVISILAQGRMAGGLLTIPEGWRALEIADALDRDHLTTRADFIRVVEHPGFPLPSFLQSAPAGSSLEGFLFPDSYRFQPNSPADQIARTMVDNFGRHLTPDLLAGFQANGLTLYQAVTLASIVEREAVRPVERPVIASVYLNRLRRGMKLQADPTVQYALVPTDRPESPVSEYWKRQLSFADLKIISPYNTYQVTGLPPGPICNPGLASLEAVAHPATSDFLYFVARPDGSHAFARTLEEHDQNVAKYRG
jgi:UPF0755 protein